MNRRFTLIPVIILCFFQVKAQRSYWQQKVSYRMDISFDVATHQYQGTQKLLYQNNSPDTLHRVFYHLYYNAFQPGSMMDVRSRTIADPDPRVTDRISKLTKEEMGYIHVKTLAQNGQPVDYTEEETILSVWLVNPLLPGESTTLEMEFEAQAPLMVRRAGCDSKEGIDYSMAQWYPKLCEYDYMGWHANPYVSREFYGVWGDYEVNITIDAKYILGGTGYLQNPNETGGGYEDDHIKVKPSGSLKTWRFRAPNVHDFVWAADPDYTHVKRTLENGTILHFLYQKSKKTKDWELLPDLLVKVFHHLNEHFGEYPYDQYSVIQGGDGGMEYPMATLIEGERNLGGILGTAIHEIVHSWYQGVLGNNESLYAWMDEGFTEYVAYATRQALFEPGSTKNPVENQYKAYMMYAAAGIEEPMTTHADHFNTNSQYSIGSYSKGAVFLNQLSYIIGKDTFMKGMRRYYNTWKFKHPTPNDFIRVMEKESGIELDWYKEYFVYTTKSIDYGIENVESKGETTEILLRRHGQMIMPIDLVVEKKDGSRVLYNIPLGIMRGRKEAEPGDMQWHEAKAWAWTNPTYSLTLPFSLKEVVSISIDPSERMADIQRENNIFTPKNN